jgi:hypothetical protein
MKKCFGYATGIAVIIVLALALVACGNTTKPNGLQGKSQAIVAQYQAAAETSVPYPLPQMRVGGWLERSLLKENLLRQNDRNRIAYVTLLNVQGQPIVQYTIQGMVFSLNSQMTTEDQVTTFDCGDNCGGQSVTKSPGDNGTWGPEPDAIGFFTTGGVEIKWNGLYLESDAPQNITTKPLIVYNVDSKPSVEGGVVSSRKNGGIKVGSATSGSTTTTK